MDTLDHRVLYLAVDPAPIPPAYTGLIGIGLIAVAFSTQLALTGFQKPATWLIGFGLSAVITYVDSIVWRRFWAPKSRHL